MFDDENYDDLLDMEGEASASMDDLADLPASQPTSPAPAPAPSSSCLLTSSLLDTREGAQPPDDTALPSEIMLERRRYATRPNRHATIPGLLPQCSINLLIGSGRSGKTTLLLSQLELYASSGEFLGYQTHPDRLPAQLGCLVASGSLDAIHDRIHAMQLEALADPTVFPVADWEPLPEETLASALRRHHAGLTQAANHPVHLLVIEGIQLMMEGSGKVSDPRAIRDFFKVFDQFCLDRNVTILATVGQAKLRRGEAYPLLADRVYGSPVWAQESQTLIGIEEMHLHLPEERRPSTRKLVIQPRGLDGPRDEQDQAEVASQPAKSGGPASLGASRTRRQPASHTNPASTPQKRQLPPARPRRPVVYADFNEQGRLLLTPTDHAEGESSFFYKLDEKLDLVFAEDPDRALTKQDFVDWADKLDIKLRTVERWLTSRCDDQLGMLERVGGLKNRTYRKPRVN
jgi:hypothetical protein